MTRGSVEHVVRAIRDWAEAARQGMALVTWKSAAERDRAVADVDGALSGDGWETQTLYAARYDTPAFLDALTTSRADALLVVDPDILIFGGGEGRSAGWLNFQREAVVAHSSAQVWFMPEKAALRFSRDLPDLARFFLLRVALTAEASVEPANRVVAAALPQEREARPTPRADRLLERLQEAPEPVPDRAAFWLQLGIPAMREYVDAGQLDQAREALRIAREKAGGPGEAFDQAAGRIPAGRLERGWFVLGRYYEEHAERSKSPEVPARRAVESYERARQLAQQEGDTSGVVTLLRRMGQICLDWLNDSQSAVRYLSEATDLATQNEADAVVTRLLLGRAQLQLGHSAEAERTLLDALAAAEKLDDAEDRDRMVTVACDRLANLYELLGRYTWALEFRRRDLELTQRRFERHPDNPEIEYELFVSWLEASKLFRTAGESALADQAYDRASAIASALLQRYPENLLYKHAALALHHEMGQQMQKSGDTDRALAAFQKAVEVGESLGGTRPEFQSSLATAYSHLGDQLLQRHELPEAERAYLRSLELRQALLDAEPERADYKRSVAFSWYSLAGLYDARGDRNRARDAARKDLAIIEELVANEPDRNDLKRDLAATLEGMAEFDPERRAEYEARVRELERAPKS